MLRDEVNDERHGAAIHEAGHASYAWHFSSRELSNPPFTEIKVKDELNPVGEYYGEVDVALSTSNFDTPTKAAICLAGIFAKECCGDESVEEWTELVLARNGTNGTDDFAAVCALAKENNMEVTALLAQAHPILCGVTEISDLIRSIAALMDERVSVRVSDPCLASLLRDYVS